MSRKYKIRDQEAVYFVTFTVVYWLDVFMRKEYRDIFLDSIRYCQQHKGLQVFAFCVMSSHIHMIISRVGEQKLEAIIRDIKKYTSVKIIEAIANNPQESRRELLLWLFAKAGKRNPNNTHYQFWHQHNHPIELNTNEKLDQRLNYIHNNPVEAGIVRYPEEYLYSSAGNYVRHSETVLDVRLI
jgi:REP element-mobilizing transposase RayT